MTSPMSPQQRGNHYAEMLHRLTFGGETVDKATGEVTRVDSYRDLAIAAGIAEAEYRAAKGNAFSRLVQAFSAARAEHETPGDADVQAKHRAHLTAQAELEARRQSLVTVKALLEHAKVERQAEIASDRATAVVGA